ncbi:Sugar transporter SemiSWEET [Burkholderiales bacterium]|nr:Sugar transporter SemiSWEET [Burkholderiales bacterium]
MTAWVDTFGYIAGTLTTVAFVPQVVRILRVRRADDLSWWTFGTFTAGVVLWLAYGLELGAAPIIVANVVMLALALSILLLKWRYRPGAAVSRPGAADARR